MDVVVFGGGYAGVTLTRNLERSLPADVGVTIVDETGIHLLQHELHRAIRRPAIAEAIQVPLSEIFDRATVRTGYVESIDTANRRAQLADDSTIEYDLGAICLGARTADYGIDGVLEHGHPLKRLEHAARIRDRFLALLAAAEDDGVRDGSVDSRRVVIGGGGLSGIQIAGELAALAAEEGSRAAIDITIVEMQGSVAPNLPVTFQEAVREELEARDVTIETDTTVQAVDSVTVRTDRGEFDYDLFVWAGGITGSDAMGGDRPIVRGDLRLHQSTFVLGDAARAIDTDGEAVPASASAAIREAETVAENLTALVEHRLEGDPEAFEPRMVPYRFEVPGWIVSIGDGAVAQVGPTVLTGRPATAIKATVGAGYLGSVRAIRQAAKLVESELQG